jgi:hypothetical protein
MADRAHVDRIDDCQLPVRVDLIHWTEKAPSVWITRLAFTSPKKIETKYAALAARSERPSRVTGQVRRRHVAAFDCKRAEWADHFGGCRFIDIKAHER